VLDLRVPEDAAGFTHTLTHQWPVYLAYLAAFLNIASIWINHHDLFTRIARVNNRLICVDLFLLLIASIFPWPAAVLSSGTMARDHHAQVIAAVLFAAIGFLVPISWILLYGYVSRHRELLADDDAIGYARTGMRQSLIPVVLYPLAALTALWQPFVAVIVYVLIPLIFIATLLIPTRVPTQEHSDALG
jgi:uncharacterized membrane protein